MTLTLKQVAERYGVGLKTAKFWVRCGELTVIDVSRSLSSQKRRLRVTQTAIEAFEALRTSTPTTPRVSQRRRGRATDVLDIIR
jgi:hypothetical protein